MHQANRVSGSTLRREKVAIHIASCKDRSAPSFQAIMYGSSILVRLMYFEQKASVPAFGGCNILFPHYELQGSAPTFQATMYGSSIPGCKVRLMYYKLLDAGLLL